MGYITGYIGTYTEAAYQGRGRGIYGFTFDDERGTIEDLRLVAETVNPTYLTLGSGFLYAVNETQNFEGKPSGGVSAFSIEAEKNSLRLINRQSSEGKDPCHIALNQGQTHGVVSNYSSGTIAVLPIEQGGGLGPAAQVIALSGSGPNRERQEASHAHFFIFDRRNAYGFACDLGADRVMAYSYDPDRAAPLTPAASPWFSVHPGAGPRHGVFASAAGDSVYYGINELDSTMDVLAYNEGRGTFSRLQTIGLLPPGVSIANTGAAIKISPGGNFVYASNRGHDSITVFKTDPSGTAVYLATVPSGGMTPRDFEIDPSGRFLLVCNQNSDNLGIFRIDPKRGLLTQEREYSAPSPVCLKFRAP
ncbi:MAG: lactonase family protein [Treponema sp.]|jgi:6-phosphogluconolactonase|nr:lactonase family protein [Treponema sp.]